MENNLRPSISIFVNLDWCRRTDMVNDVLKIVKEIQKECPDMLVHIEARFD
ncbi:MAG: hypothetical protein E7L17_14905 [Clostridium sp.]|uniref:hypothetical protein n=1 Tax=Clostridium sp. TaxID=1506 RepID=UPI002908926C|nr:hypothetical protein [Clostridium sp.]MDU7339391.1 hypothetical protein [Clostridium sp.]